MLEFFFQVVCPAFKIKANVIGEIPMKQSTIKRSLCFVKVPSCDPS